MDFLEEIDAIQVDNWMSIIQDHTDALNRHADALERVAKATEEMLAQEQKRIADTYR